MEDQSPLNGPLLRQHWKYPSFGNAGGVPDGVRNQAILASPRSILGLGPNWKTH